jgi:hypothetical protein
MRHQMISLVGTALLGLSVATLDTNAHAQEEQTYLKPPLRAPSNAFELQLSTGYAQGFGNISPGNSIISVAGAGMGFTADLDYRMSPFTSFGIEGQYQTFLAENNSSSTQGLDLNLGLTFHGRPESRGDPWLRLGTGYRMFWQSTQGPLESSGTTHMFHGFDLVTARIGYDIRASSHVAFAPIVGADLQTFVWENGTRLSSVQWGTFVYAGLQGRFDAGGSSAPNVARADVPSR